MSTSTDLAAREPEIELIETADTATTGLFGSTDPTRIVTRVAEIATVLAGIINEKRLYVSISGRQYVTVEGWQLLGALTGLVAYTVWSRPIEGGWEARVEIRRASDGRPLAAAEGECLRAERKWAKADDYAIRSMSMTRATSKAFRLAVGFVMSLSGYEATPASEVADAVVAGGEGKIPDAAKPSREQWARTTELLAQLAEKDPSVDWPDRAREICGVSGDMLTGGGAATLIDRLEAELFKRAA